MGRSPESPGRTLALADHRRYGPLRPGCDRIDRKRRPCAKIAALSLGIVLTLLQALPALAQIGTPGNAPLTPDGPRRGLGPPSITDHVPDIRLRSEGNGIPGAGPPIVPGRRVDGPAECWRSELCAALRSLPTAEVENARARLRDAAADLRSGHPRSCRSLLRLPLTESIASARIRRSIAAPERRDTRFELCAFSWPRP